MADTLEAPVTTTTTPDASAAATAATTTPPASSQPNFSSRDLLEASVEVNKSAETANVATTDANTATANTVTADANTASEPWDRKDGPEPSRWHKTVENIRSKERAAVEAEFAWAKDIRKEDGEGLSNFIRVANEDPIKGADLYIRQLASDPATHAPLRAWMLGMLGIDEGQLAGVTGANTASGQTTTYTGKEMPQPDIPTDSSNGKPVVYSAERMQQLMAWQAQQLKVEFQKELDPFKQDRVKAAATAKQAEDAAKIDKAAAEAVADLKKQPGFEANAEEIGKVALTLTNSGKSVSEVLYQAYLHVVGPKFQAQAAQDYVKAQTNKASAGTLNPSQAAPQEPFNYDTATLAEVLAYEAKKAQK